MEGHNNSENIDGDVPLVPLATSEEYSSVSIAAAADGAKNDANGDALPAPAAYFSVKKKDGYGSVECSGDAQLSGDSDDSNSSGPSLFGFLGCLCCAPFAIVPPLAFLIYFGSAIGLIFIVTCVVFILLAIILRLCGPLLVHIMSRSLYSALGEPTLVADDSDPSTLIINGTPIKFDGEAEEADNQA